MPRMIQPQKIRPESDPDDPGSQINPISGLPEWRHRAAMQAGLFRPLQIGDELRQHVEFSIYRRKAIYAFSKEDPTKVLLWNLDQSQVDPDFVSLISLHQKEWWATGTILTQKEMGGDAPAPKSAEDQPGRGIKEGPVGKARRPGFHGVSTCGLIRWLADNNKTFNQITALMAKIDPSVNPSTIKIQFAKGQRGQGKPVEMPAAAIQEINDLMTTPKRGK